MAVDEMLLNQAIGDSMMPVLRIYSWSKPTLSLGYFQEAREVDHYPQLLTVPLVRRCTGGGAILHDQEWTYSVVLPHPLAQRFPSRTLYESVHSSLRQALKGSCISTDLHESIDDLQTEKETEFLCFSRRAKGDLVGNGFKIAGSAQRRKRGALLQHGSVLMRTSSLTPELSGILEIAPLNRSPQESLQSAWISQLSEVLGLELSASSLSDAELELASALMRTKYQSAWWTHRK